MDKANAMDESAIPVNRMVELPEETRQFLAGLSRDDVATLRTGLPIIKAIVGFGKVTKWLAIVSLGILGGVVMFGESVMKIVSWFRQ